MILRVLKDRQAELLHVGLAVRLTGILPRSREDGEEDCCKNSYDRYYHEQLDQCETTVPFFHRCYPFAGSEPPGNEAYEAALRRLLSGEPYLFIRILSYVDGERNRKQE